MTVDSCWVGHIQECETLLILGRYRQILHQQWSNSGHQNIPTGLKNRQSVFIDAIIVFKLSCQQSTEDPFALCSNLHTVLLFPLDEADGERSLNLCEGDPVLRSTRAGGDGEQEVPRGTHREASTAIKKKHRGVFCS